MKRAQALFNLFFLMFLISITLPSVAQSSNDRSKLVQELNQHNSGVQVIAHRDTLRIIMSVDRFFKFPSDNRIYLPKNASLDKIAMLVRTYGNRPIIVSGHTDHVGSDEWKLERSREQAETVAGYLWSNGVGLNNLLILGCADTEPVSSNTTARGSGDNRRIEITIGLRPDRIYTTRI
ncbi:MAG: outer membrane protein [Gammaproteobacteria bacterium]|jgi:outer membrane protein OmpA-like peptidoglycan-associated protein|nr:outer membrane protein [Gammaproteobacteria bacterium]